MKYGELLQLFSKNGIVFVRHGRSHDIYYSPLTENRISVPRHTKEIPTGTAKKIKKDAGLE